MRLLGLLLLSALAAFAAPRVQIQDTVNDQDGVPFVGVVTIRLNQSCYQADGQYVSAARPTVVRLGTGTDQTHNAGQLDVSLYPNATGSCGPPDVPADEGTSYQVRYEDTVTPNANVRSEYWVIPAVAGPLRIMDIMQPLPPPTPGIAVQPQNILAGGAGDGWHMIFNLLNGRWTPTPFASLANPMTQTNQMIRGGASGTPVALAAPITIGHVLTFTATGLEWVEPASGGVVDHSLLTNLDFPNSGHTGFAAEVHASRHQFGGADPVATATPAANAILQADGSGNIAVGWLPSLGTIYVPTNRNLTGGSGVASIGDLSQDRTVNLDFLSEPLDAAPAGTSALLIEISAGVFRRVLWSSLPGAGGGGLDNAYTQMTDGTTSSGAVGADTFKYRALNNKLGITVTDNDATHGDNALFQINEANLVLSNMGGQVLDSQVPNNISLDNLTQITVRNYSDLQNIPATFPPSAHNHPISDVTGLQAALDGKEASLGTGTATQFLNGLKNFVAIDWTDIANKPATFAPSAHATSHQEGGTDEVATATPAANAIAKADADSRFSEAWMKHRPALVTTTPHSFTATDRDRRVIFNSASAIASSIPGCGTAGFEDGYEVIAYNWGAGAVTITPGAGTILGSSNLQMIEQTGGILTCRAAATNYEFIVISDNLVTSIGNIPTSRVGFPAVPGSSQATLEDVQNTYWASGAASGGTITAAGGGTIDVTSGVGLIRSGSSYNDPLFTFEWAAESGLAIPANATRWVVAEYNAGSPRLVLRSARDWNALSEFLIGVVHNDAGELKIANAPWRIDNGVGRLMDWFSAVWGYQRAEREGGLNIRDNAQYVQMDAGALYALASRFPIAAFDSAGTDRFDGYYRDGGGGFVKQNNVQTWPTSQYDDGSGTLANLANNRYGTLWWALLINGEIELIHGYSNAQSIEQARNEDAPSAPGFVGTLGRFVARWVIREGETSPVLVESIFQPFEASALAFHNELTGRDEPGSHPNAAITGSAGVSGTPSVGNCASWTSATEVGDAGAPCGSGGGGGGSGAPIYFEASGGTAQIVATVEEHGFTGASVIPVHCVDTGSGIPVAPNDITQDSPTTDDVTVDFLTADTYTCAFVGIGATTQVSGPGSSTDNAITRFSGTTGGVLQNSGLIISDADLLGTGEAVTDAVWKFTTGGSPGIAARLGDDSTTAFVQAANLWVSAGGQHGWASGTDMLAPVNGNLLLRDNAGTDFGLLQLGGTTSSFPALKRSTTALHARLADDSAYADFVANSLVEGANAVPNATDELDFFGAQSAWDSAVTKTTADLTFSGVEADFNAGAANAWPKLLTETTPTGTDCDAAAEYGRLLFDDDLDTNGSVMVCTSSGWKDVDDDGGAGGFASFDIDGDNNSPQTISDGEEALFVGGDGIDTTAAVTRQVTIDVDSSEADFLNSGALTCGASTQGKAQVHTTPLQYCDNAATPALQYAAYAASDGDALAGDTALNFFDAGTFEDARISQSSVDQHATATPTGSRIPLAEADGDLNAGWIGLDQSYTWTGTQNFQSATITVPAEAYDPTNWDGDLGPPQKDGVRDIIETLPDTGSCTNQFVTATNASAAPTCTTATLAGAQFANQGTTTTVLHGNAAGNPSFAQVDLTAAVTGVLPEANLPDMSTTAQGVVEAAIASEIDTGTSAALAATPDALAGSNMGERIVMVEVFEATTDNATGDGKVYYHIPSTLTGMDLVEVNAHVVNTGTTGTLNIDLAKCDPVATGNQCTGTVGDMLTTNLTIDSGENKSATAAAAAAINTAQDDVTTDDVIRIDIDAAHTTPAKGLILSMTYRLP